MQYPNLFFRDPISQQKLTHLLITGGWDRLTEAIPPTLEAQIAQAFDNIEHTLQLSGSKGWSEVYSVRCYTTKVEEEELGLIAKYLKQYCPDHAPILTGVAVGGLFEGMLVEIEVSAHVRGE